MSDIHTQAGVAQAFTSNKSILSGFNQIDTLTSGFRLGGCYLVAGIEKSGKSALLMKMVGEFIKDHKTLFVNTELSDSEFLNRMTAISLKRSITDIEEDTKSSGRDSEVIKWAREHKDTLIHEGIESGELLENNSLSFTKTMNLIDKEVKSGCKIVVIDNLTTYKNSTGRGQAQWEVLSQVLTQLINYIKSKNILCFVVIHTKSGTVFKETPAGIRSILKSGEPEKIFEESVAIVSKPTLQDVYGGSGILSQLSGAMLLWRPFQKVAEVKYQKMASVILESFRNSPNGEVRMLWSGEHLRFDEVQSSKELLQNVEEALL